MNINRYKEILEEHSFFVTKRLSKYCVNVIFVLS
jgi:hypothetical protein